MKKIIRARQFMYVQDLQHLKVKEKDLQKILNQSGAIEWAYIKHDQEIKQIKEIDKKNSKTIRPHLHVVLKYKNPHLITTIAKLFKDKPQYVDIWKGKIANAYSYLLHETDEAKKSDKFHYKDSNVIASFDFSKRMKKIRKGISTNKKIDINALIDNYANNLISFQELEKEIGITELAKRKRLIDQIDTIKEQHEHDVWMKKFKGKKMKALWLYGPSGVGKTVYAEQLFKDKKYVILGSSRDYFQPYHGEHFIILNDLRPNDFHYSDLLRILDPYQHDKAAPSRYHDKILSAQEIIITTPYSPEEFYKSTNIVDLRIDTYDQLARRIQAIKITPAFIKKHMKDSHINPLDFAPFFVQKKIQKKKR